MSQPIEHPNRIGCSRSHCLIIMLSFDRIYILPLLPNFFQVKLIKSTHKYLRRRIFLVKVLRMRRSYQMSARKQRLLSQFFIRRLFIRTQIGARIAVGVIPGFS